MIMLCEHREMSSWRGFGSIAFLGLGIVFLPFAFLFASCVLRFPFLRFCSCVLAFAFPSAFCVSLIIVCIAFCVLVLKRTLFML